MITNGTKSVDAVHLFLIGFYLLTLIKGDDYICSESHPHYGNPLQLHIRGVNIGGWLVIEPWITPSLFYQFLGKQNPKEVGMDMFTFCSALGPAEGNKQLRRHWDAWLKEEHFESLSSSGINSIRIPIGDWMFKPYGPYQGCTDGALEQLERSLRLAEKYELKVLLDVHGFQGSQNGFDNSGKAENVKWTNNAGKLSFSHWKVRAANWVGEYNRTSKSYNAINTTNIHHSLNVLERIAQIYKNHKIIIGLTPINEPWENTPLEVLKKFYWDGYQLVKALAPNWNYIISDSFKFELKHWRGFMKGCSGIALDTHIYQAWHPQLPAQKFYDDACSRREGIQYFEKHGMPLIIGEWSLATDNCAMWLNGFNDNAPGYPLIQCSMQRCKKSYLDVTLPQGPPQGPYGTGNSTPQYGNCPDSPANIFDIPDDVFLRKLATKKLLAFQSGHGWYFWNFRTEMASRWSYLESLKRGWIPNLTQGAQEIFGACESKEYFKDYTCKLKDHILECKELSKRLCSLKGFNCNSTIESRDSCQQLVTKYWNMYGVCIVNDITELKRINEMKEIVLENDNELKGKNPVYIMYKGWNLNSIINILGWFICCIVLFRGWILRRFYRKWNKENIKNFNSKLLN